jgi:hypothetical protein
MRIIVLLALVGNLSAVSSQRPAADWLPPPTQDFVVTQLAERLQEIQLPWPEARRVSAARATVAAIRARLEEWTEPGVLKRTPALAHLKLPPSGNQRLDAMVRYHMCTALSMIRHERRGREPSEEARIAAVVGMTTGSIVVLYLRDGFIKAGGTGEQVEKVLTAPALQGAIDRLQTSPDDALAAQSECVPVFGEITG